MDPMLSELHKRHGDALSKYAYFLLALTAAAMAFSLQRSEKEVFGLLLLPLALAMVSWAFSFMSGIKNLTYTNACVAANHTYLQLKFGCHPNQPAPHLVGSAMEGTLEGLDKNMSSAARYGKAQLWLFVFGALLYVVWHVAKIWANSNAT